MSRKELLNYLETQHNRILDYFDNGTNNENKILVTIDSHTMLINAYKLTIINGFLRKEKDYPVNDELEEYIKSIISEKKDNLNTIFIMVKINMYEYFLKELNKNDFVKDFRKISDNTYVVPMRQSAITGKYILGNK